MACQKKITIVTTDNAYSVSYENTEFRNGGRLYLTHDLGDNQKMIKKYHPVGVNGNFVNYLGYTGQAINFIVQYVGTFEDVEKNIFDDRQGLYNKPSTVTLVLDVGGTKRTFSFPRCTLESFSINEGPRAVVLPNKKYVRSICGLSFTAEQRGTVS